jgi:hypothetical protein
MSTTKQYRVHTGDGTTVDGSLHSSRAAALRLIKRHRFLTRAYLAEHCAGDAWSVYGTAKERSADKTGEYSDTITLVGGACDQQVDDWG